MKILMVLMGLEIGGAETHVAELSMELARRGHEVHIASNGGVYEKEVAGFGIKHHSLPLHTKKPLSMIKSYFGLKKIIKDNRFDIVHAHARIPAFLCRILQIRLKFRFITSAHWVFKTNFWLKHITSWGERSVAVSNDIKKYLTDSYGYPTDKIDVTINGIDTNKFSADTDWSDIKEEFALKDGKFRIVYVSRMDTDRSAVAFNLLEITPKLYEKYHDIEIVIVGGGNDYNRLVNKAADVNRTVGENIVICTNARTDINKFVAAGNIFIGVSRAALEAMSAQKPVIIAGNEGYIGIFGKDKTDIAIKTNFCCRGCSMPDNEKLFSDICKIIDCENPEEMGLFNRQFIIDNYSVGKMTDDYELSYSKLLEKNPFRPNDVLISGYYGFKNIGDDSLLQSIVNNLRHQKEDISITVLSRNPSETSTLYGVNSINRFNFPKIYRILRHTRLLISGGGSLLQDVTSTKSYRYYSAIIKMALKSGTKVMVYANGIGPLLSGSNRADCKKLLEKVDIITLRDANSLRELREMGIERDISVTADPAFSLECGICSPASRDYFIVSVRKWKHLSDNFEKTISDICIYVYEKYGLQPVFVPMQNKLDSEICARIARSCGGKVVSGFNGIEQLLCCFKNCRFIIGMRLHALIYSLSMGVPVIALSYDPKIDAIVDKWTCCKGFSAKNADKSEITEQIDYIMENRDEISAKITEITDIMKDETIRDAKTAVELLKF